MKLVSQELRNFKGVKHFKLAADGGNVDVFGDNATGKTTLFDSFHWLLFGKDSHGRTDFEIKTLGPDGEPLHGLEHTVTGEFVVRGKPVTLAKTFKEKWTKKRGTARAEFTGHTTTYAINGVPAKKGEFDGLVAGIADENVFRLLTDPRAFAALHWQKRRELLLEVCGDISDADVITSEAALARLPEILGDHTLDDHRKVIVKKRRAINKELEQIPARIDEVERGLPDASEADPDALAAELEDLQERRKMKDAERTRIESGGEVAEKQKRLAEVETEMLEMELQSRTHQVNASDGLRKDLSALNDAIDGVKREIRGCEKDIAESAEADALEQTMADLRDKWTTVNAVVFEHKASDACPTCGQDLPADQIQAALEAARADFNTNKAQQLEAITAKGKRLAEKVKGLRELVAHAREQKADAEKRLVNLRAKAARLQERISAAENTPPTPAALPPQHAKLAMERDRLTMEIAELREGNTDTLERLAGEIETLDQEITVAQAQIARIGQREQGETRIMELKDRERDLAAEYERLEGELYLCEQFIRTKVALLEDKINGKFEFARFKLFNTLVNGGVEECCDITYKGVPWGSLNRGAQTNVGLDIIRALSDHYNFYPPIFIDNAEAVTRLIPMRAQVIRLVVSAADKKLRVEPVEPVEQGVLKEVI